MFRTNLAAVEQSGYPSSHSVAARLSSDSVFSRRGSETAGNVTRNVVTHVDAGSSTPVTSLSVGDIPLSRVPHTTSGKLCFLKTFAQYVDRNAITDVTCSY